MAKKTFIVNMDEHHVGTYEIEAETLAEATRLTDEGHEMKYIFGEFIEVGDVGTVKHKDKSSPIDWQAEVSAIMGNEAWEEIKSYSGRCMFGKISIFAMTCRIAPDSNESKMLSDLGMVCDYMGVSYIYYTTETFPEA